MTPPRFGHIERDEGTTSQSFVADTVAFAPAQGRRKPEASEADASGITPGSTRGDARRMDALALEPTQRGLQNRNQPSSHGGAGQTERAGPRSQPAWKAECKLQ